VEPAGLVRRPERRLHRVEEALPEPALRVRREASLFLVGIGGTGVVTVNQILGTAALLDGKHLWGLDQTGLSQKGGPVVSHLKIADHPVDLAGKVGVGEADAYLGFDLLVATAPQSLARARPDLTIAVVSTSAVPTGAMVASPDVQFPEAAGLRTAVDRVSRKDENVYLDALGLAEALFGDHLAANMLVLGAAYQAGAIPVRAVAIERAIALNAASVEMNTHAFRAGRLLVADPTWAATVRRRRAGQVESTPVLTAGARGLVESVGATGELRRLLDVRVPELIAYQDAAYAGRYVAFVERVAAAERSAVDGDTRLSEAVARYLFKLMAYKDEYEVARLQTTPELPRSIAAEFPGGVRLRYHLHPPILRALGWKRKVTVGKWFDPVFRALVAARRLRGTPFDPFGYAHLRRVERALVGEYRAMVEGVLTSLSPESYERAVQAARLPDLVRGYESIKLRSVERFRAEARALGVAPGAG
jgi:indolepyruvate ferredoxin oxidoreductase